MKVGLSKKAVALKYGVPHTTFRRYLRKRENNRVNIDWRLEVFKGASRLTLNYTINQKFTAKEEMQLRSYLQTMTRLHHGLNPKDARKLAFDLTVAKRKVYLYLGEKTGQLEHSGSAPPGTEGVASPSGWMTSELFVQWIMHFIRHAKPAQASPFLLMMDNYHIFLLTLLPHTSHRLQPLDKLQSRESYSHVTTELDNVLPSNPFLRDKTPVRDNDSPSALHFDKTPEMPFTSPEDLYPYPKVTSAPKIEEATARRKVKKEEIKKREVQNETIGVFRKPKTAKKKEHESSVCVTESKNKGQGAIKIDEFIFIWFGVHKLERAKAGVAILIKKNISKHIRDIKYVSDRHLKVIVADP
ncbi:hypothetical protein ILUMI_04414 [Ignelater luminosus]|uniref:HTH psq-type domain-containing protein n=1 Tax=Ignelater luminosus TaxID=2038154 RepID=A0A8K0GEK8_IGNLU|nr:hypothetical protein ILUMI_04414 [Ignelater luminosus]